MGQPNEGLQALLDVRHDHQFIDDGIGRLGGDDAGLGDTQIAAGLDALLGMADGGTLHRSLHGACTAAGAGVQSPQAQLVTDLFTVVVFGASDSVTAPANHHGRGRVGVHHSGIAQNVEYGVGETAGAAQIEAVGIADFVVHVDQIPQHGKQVLADTLDHLAVHECRRRGVLHGELQAPVLLHNLHGEILVATQNLGGVGLLEPRIQHSQRAVAPQIVQTSLAGGAQLAYLPLGENFQAALGGNPGVYFAGPGVSHRSSPPRCGPPGRKARDIG